MSERIPFVQVDTGGAPALDAVTDGSALSGTELGLLIVGKDGSNNAQFIKTGTDGAVAVTDNSGSLTVDSTQLPSALVSGRLSVDGSGVTQPISAASLPLPSGAATAAKQPALGTAGSASTDVITVQGIASMTALKVDGSAVTQPVSDGGGSLTVDGSVSISGTPNVAVTSSVLPTGAATAAKQPALGTAGSASADVITVQGVASMTALKVDGSAVTQPISASALPLPTGASTSAKQPALGTAGSASTDVITVQGIASMTALKVDGSAVTQPVSGTVTANIGTSGSLALDATLTGGTQQSKITDGTNVASVKAASTAAVASDKAVVVAVSPNNSVAISAASLPLPSGAATSAKQPALGTAGTASTDVITVQGIASMTALKVDGSAVTQPVSGTVTANIGTSGSLALDATLTGGTQQTKITDGTNVASVKAASTAAVATDKAVVVAVSPNNSVAITAASLPLPTGASTAAKQPALGTAGTASTDVITVQGITSMTALKVDGSAVTQPVSGTVTANIGTVGTLATAANQTTLGSQTTKINDGTNTAAVKAASTAAVATDPALVVAVSPNNSVTVTQGTAAGSAWPMRITDNTNNTVVKAASTAAATTDAALVVAISPNDVGLTAATSSGNAVSTSSISVLSANTSRAMAAFQNVGSVDVYLYCHNANNATTSNFTVKLAPNAYYELPVHPKKGCYQGAVKAITASGSSTLEVQEYT